MVLLLQKIIHIVTQAMGLSTMKISRVNLSALCYFCLNIVQYTVPDEARHPPLKRRTFYNKTKCILLKAVDKEACRFPMAQHVRLLCVMKHALLACTHSVR